MSVLYGLAADLERGDEIAGPEVGAERIGDG